MSAEEESARSLELIAEEGPMIHCMSWSAIQGICRAAAKVLRQRASVPEERSSKAWSEMSQPERAAYNAGAAAAERDAARYRWLRDRHGVISDPDGAHTYYIVSQHEPLDAVIDAGMRTDMNKSLQEKP